MYNTYSTIGRPCLEIAASVDYRSKLIRSAMQIVAVSPFIGRRRHIHSLMATVNLQRYVYKLRRVAVEIKLPTPPVTFHSNLPNRTLRSGSKLYVSINHAHSQPRFWGRHVRYFLGEGAQRTLGVLLKLLYALNATYENGCLLAFGGKGRIWGQLPWPPWLRTCLSPSVSAQCNNQCIFHPHCCEKLTILFEITVYKAYIK